MKEPENPRAKRWRVFLVDDHPMVRERLAELINRQKDLAVCGQAADATQALQEITSTQPDLALVDLTLKGTHGIELIKDLRARGEKTLVLVLSMHDESIYAERVLRAGARGYITKQQPSRAIIGAIREVLAGGIYVSREIAGRMGRAPAVSPSDEKIAQLRLLSDRELEIYQLIGQGCATREIASSLRLDTKTVETYRVRIKEKLELATATELIHHATDWVLREGTRPH